MAVQEAAREPAIVPVRVPALATVPAAVAPARMTVLAVAPATAQMIVRLARRAVRLDARPAVPDRALCSAMMRRRVMELAQEIALADLCGKGGKRYERKNRSQYGAVVSLL